MTGLDPKAAFYLVAPIDNLDGTFSPPSADGRESFATLEEARRYIEADKSAFPGEELEYVCFRCEPIE